MNSKELQSALAKRVQESRKKQIWQKAVRIAETFGKKERYVAKWYTTTSYNLDITLNGIRLLIYKSNYAMGGDYIHIDVLCKSAHDRDTKHHRVFEASESSHYQETPDEKQRTFRVGKNQDIRVECYSPGDLSGALPHDWTRELNFNSVKKAVIQARKAEAEVQRKHREQERNRQPLTEEERRVAQAFSVRTL